MTRLVIVGCSSKKADDPRPAKDLYESTYWDAKRAYGSAVGDDWRILSAQHVILDPECVIDPYERHIDDLRGVPVQSDRYLPSGERVTTRLDAWACGVTDQTTEFVETATTGGDVRVDVLLGHSYEDPLRDRDVFEHVERHADADVEIRWPFREVDGLTGNGLQISCMQEQAAAARDA
jgi:hypothetical protein